MKKLLKSIGLALLVMVIGTVFGLLVYLIIQYSVFLFLFLFCLTALTAAIYHSIK